MRLCYRIEHPTHAPPPPCIHLWSILSYQQYLHLLQRIANASSESQRMHIIPPSTKPFYIKYTKKVTRQTMLTSVWVINDHQYAFGGFFNIGCFPKHISLSLFITLPLTAINHQHHLLVSLSK